MIQFGKYIFIKCIIASVDIMYTGLDGNSV